MSAHPTCCHTHACDLCRTCLSGVCCLTVSSDDAASAIQQQRDLDRLRDSIAADQAARPSFLELLQTEVWSSLIRQFLTAVPAPEPVFDPPGRREPQDDEHVRPELPRPEPPALPSANPARPDLLAQCQPTVRRLP